VTAADRRLPDVLSTLRRSHDRLVTTVEPLSASEVEGPAYPSDWSIAQTVSHLGSGAEIFGLMFDAAVGDEPLPDSETYKAVWSVWDSKSPADQAADGLRSDAALLARVDALTPEQAERFRVALYNGDQDLEGFLQTRLGEHALHTWDVVVPGDPTAGVDSDAAALILEGLPWLLERVGKPAPVPVHLAVITHDPDRRLQLDIDEDGPRLAPLADDADPGESVLRLPTEAFIRLVYGRLDAEHTPAYESEGIDLDSLRRAFPGF
jgi:uncharacterized protein (TIGR03083 family)